MKGSIMKKTTIWIDGKEDMKITINEDLTDNDRAARLLGYSNYRELHDIEGGTDENSPLNFEWSRE